MKPSVDALRFFAEFIQRELGIIYNEANFYQLEVRLCEVARLAGLSGPDELFLQAKLGFSPQIKRLVVDLATNNETSFFRDITVFKVIEDIVLKDFLAHPARQSMRIWSAACSYGQEPYSLAMTIEPHFGSLAHGYEITATDISEQALKAAERGVFTQLQVQRGLSDDLLMRYFVPDHAGDSGQSWQARPEIRRRISFSKLNLLDSFAGVGPFDLILCRNVLIYQALERKREIVAKLRARLNPRGYLILGAAESMLGISDAFEPIQAGNVTLFRARGGLAQSA